jgi:hypothetical protein
MYSIYDNLHYVLSDSGWIWLNGPYGDDKQGCSYRLRGGMVTVSINLGGDSNIKANGSGVALGALPSKYRPPFNLTGAASGKGSGLCQFGIDAAGVVKVWNLTTSSVYFGAIVTYPV